jgi:hypothetical protein
MREGSARWADEESMDEGMRERDGDVVTWKHSNETLIILASEVAALDQDEELFVRVSHMCLTLTRGDWSTLRSFSSVQRNGCDHGYVSHLTPSSGAKSGTYASDFFTAFGVGGGFLLGRHGVLMLDVVKM